MSTLPVLSGSNPEELSALLAPLPRFRAAQVFKWIAAGASSFSEMKNLPLSLREELSVRFALRGSSVSCRQDAPDGTVKLGLRLFDGAVIEAVLLSDGEGRKTACLSTQAGCPAGCVFCKTGSLGFLRNLQASEIVEQFLFLREAAGRDQDTASPAGREISNIVIMGMGEPLLNLAELRKALAVFGEKEGLHFSMRRITVSTCGISEGIKSLADNGPGARLALSLTTADEALRRRLMPLTARYPLGGVKEALRYFQRKGGGRVTLEAALFAGLNTRPEDARALAAFAEGLSAAVNLIPWNPVSGLAFEGTPLREPPPEEIASFSARLEALGLTVTRRLRKGRAVCGACGQLGLTIMNNILD